MVKTSKKQARKRRGSRKSFDYEKVVPEVIREVVERLAIDYLNLTEKELIEIIEPIVVQIVENRKTKPSIESLVKRIIRNKQLLFKAIAAKLIEREELNLDQLEFIVANAPELAGRATPLLYRHAIRYGADYILDSLRALWLRYGKPSKIKCPYCGFYSVTSNLQCLVCGREVDEKDLKSSIGFTRLLESTVERFDSSLVEEILRAGYVIYAGEIYPPSYKPLHKDGIIIYLSRKEKEKLRSLLYKS